MRHHRLMEEREKTQEMKIEQADAETRERKLADEEPTEAGTATHERRADKAAYLKEKLAEREKSERRAEEEG